MNSPKTVVSLGFILILSVILTACGGGGSTPKTPAGPPTIKTASLPQGAVNTPYGSTGLGVAISATGGTGAYTWSISSGSLPPGLTLNSSTGVISGTPTTLGNYPFTAQVTDAAGRSATQNLSIYIEGVVSITPSVLPSGSVRVAYSQTLTASGGLTPYTWCVLAGTPPACDPTQASLPAGLSLNTTTGVISGTPTTNGTPTTFTVQVADSETSPGVPAVGSSNFTITIMSITTMSLPSGYVTNPGTPYSGVGALTVAGGNPPYTWSATNLPPGLMLDSSTCISNKKPTCSITGTPTKPGVYPVTVQVMDGEKQVPVPMATATLRLTVYNGSPLLVTTTSLPAGIAGLAYSATLAASGGTPPFTWSIASGSLPPGLNLDPNSGVISGKPTAPSTSSFTVQVADSGSPPQTATSGQLSIVINPPLTNGNLNGNYVFTFSGYKGGTPVLMAGSFVADGNGNITSGVLDYNDGTGEAPDNNPTPQTIGAGSVYSISPNGLGTMTLVTNLSPPSPYSFNVSIRSDGSGRLIQSDPKQPQAYGSGEIIGNTPLNQGETFPLCGKAVALGFFGFDSTLVTRFAGAGQFQFDPTTCVDAENGVMDADDGGTVSSPTFTGAFNVLVLNTSRGVTGLTLNPGGRHFYAFYLVSSSDRKINSLFWVSTEPASQPAALTLWSGFQQASSALCGSPSNWNNSCLNGTAVAELNALDTNGAVDVTAGLFVGKGAQANNCQNKTYDAATLTYDENQGGTSNLQQSSTGTYCVDKTTGRVTLKAFSNGPFAVPPVFYLVKGDQGFVVGTDPAVTSGYLEQQTGSSFTNSSIGGSYAGGTVTPIIPQVTDAATWLLADASGNLNGTSDTSGPNGPGQQNFAYTYTVDSTGRTVVQQSGTPIGIAYVISPTKFVLLPTTDPNPALSILGQ